MPVTKLNLVHSCEISKLRCMKFLSTIHLRKFLEASNHFCIHKSNMDQKWCECSSAVTKIKMVDNITCAI